MKQFLIALLIVVVAGGAYFWWQGNSTPQEAVEETDPFGMNGSQNQIPEDAIMEDGVMPDRTPTTGETSNGSGSASSAPMMATVTYDGTTFSPASVTIKKGGTVTWTSTGGEMWVASAQHPTHTAYSGTNLQEHCAAGATKSFDQCASGGTYSFTFDKAGTWNYHNHLNASARGTVIVIE